MTLIYQTERDYLDCVTHDHKEGFMIILCIVLLCTMQCKYQVIELFLSYIS